MDYRMIQLLLEKIDKKHFASILKRSYANNKSFRVPGFANIQKVPPPILWNQIKTRPLFTKELLFSTFLEFAPMQPIEEEDPLNRIMEQITDSNQLGIIALLLMKDDEESNREAAQLLASMTVSSEGPKVSFSSALPDAGELPDLAAKPAEATQSTQSAGASEPVDVSGTSGVSEPAGVSGTSGVSEPADISGTSRVSEPAGVSGTSETSGDSKPAGSAGSTDGPDGILVPAPAVDPDTLAREKEKARKLKLKYNELKKDRDDLRALVKDLQKGNNEKQTQIASVQKELEEAKQTIETQKQTLTEQETLISVLRREVSMLKSNEKIEKQQPKTIDALVLALGCDGRLEKFRNRLQLEFELPTSADEESSLETVLTRYDEIWVSPLAPFSIRRQLQRCKPDPAHRIYFFRSFAELLMHVNKFCSSK